jgi:hypothetical protein
MHLRHVAGSFGDGDFALPMFIHGQLPSGVPVMQRLKSKITYAYEEMERGARVRIVTADPDALAAVHDFLRFQIQDHRTGDPQEAPPR